MISYDRYYVGVKLKQPVWKANLDSYCYELQIFRPETTGIGNSSRKLGIANIVHPWREKGVSTGAMPS